MYNYYNKTFEKTLNVQNLYIPNVQQIKVATDIILIFSFHDLFEFLKMKHSVTDQTISI